MCRPPFRSGELSKHAPILEGSHYINYSEICMGDLSLLHLLTFFIYININSNDIYFILWVIIHYHFVAQTVLVLAIEVLSIDSCVPLMFPQYYGLFSFWSTSLLQISSGLILYILCSSSRISYSSRIPDFFKLESSKKHHSNPSLCPNH